MKIIILVIMLVFMLCGCSLNTNNQTSEATNSLPEGITLIHESEDFGNSYSCDQIPFSLPYGETSIQCSSAKLYQSRSEHGYYVYALIEVNVNDISDDDLYWLEKNEELNPSIMIDNESNNMENKHLSNLCRLEKGGIIYYVLDSLEEYRYSFENSNVSLFIHLDNGKMYDSYMYSFDVENVTDISEIDKDIYNAINDALQRKIEFWKDFIK